MLAKDDNGVRDALGDALAAVREIWEPEITARNLRLMRKARDKRGEQVAWAKQVEESLEREANG